MNKASVRRAASIGLLVVLSAFVILHLLILLQIIPFEMVWGGRLKDSSQMLVFESVSIFFNLIMLAVVAIDAAIIRVKINPRITKIAFWVMFALFILNTAGNLLSENETERLLFTPFTLLLALFSLRLATSERQKDASLNHF